MIPKELQQAWLQATDQIELSIDKDTMIDSFNKFYRKERQLRLTGFLDLIGGLTFLLIVVVLTIKKPEMVESITVGGKVGAVMFFLAFVIFQYSSLKIKLTAEPNSTSAFSWLDYQISILKARINLFKDLKWMLLFGLSGLYLLIISYDPFMPTLLIAALMLLIYGGVLYWLGQREIKKLKSLKTQTESMQESLTAS